MQQKLDEILRLGTEKIKEALTPAALQDVKAHLLGKQGLLTEILKEIPKLDASERADVGRATNVVKAELSALIDAQREELTLKALEVPADFDLSLPGISPSGGALHPITQMCYDLNDAFRSMGFEIFEESDITSELYAFDNLNFPPDHPARESMDTYWLAGFDGEDARGADGVGVDGEGVSAVGADGSACADYNDGESVDEKVSDSKSGGDKLCLRPHLTGASVRYLQTHKPPCRFVYPGRAYRNEATDARHERAFFQYEALIVDKQFTFSAGKIMIKSILSKVFGRDVAVRMRVGFFPFVEPGFEIDMECVVCSGKGCSVCKNVGWIEIMPGGTPHPNVLKSAGLDPNEYTGFYVNIGLDRLCMMRYGIDDVRLFRSGDIRFLNQFR